MCILIADYPTWHNDWMTVRSFHALRHRLVNCICSCHFPVQMTISPALAWEIAVLIAYSLCGMTRYQSDSVCYMPCIISASILYLSSVSGSSSVKIARSLYLSAIFAISGLLYLSLLPVAPQTTIRRCGHLNCDTVSKTLCKPPGVCAKSTK